MVYNNNSYSGYNCGYSGGGQSRPPQRSGYGAQQRPAYNQPLAEIQAFRRPRANSRGCRKGDLRNAARLPALSGIRLQLFPRIC